MSPINRLVAAAAIVLAVGGLSVFVLSNRGGGSGATPPPSLSVVPSATASPPPSSSPSIAPSPSAPLSTADWIPFASARYGYAIAYPPTWGATQAQRAWVFDTDRRTVPLTSADHFVGGPEGNQVGLSGWSADVQAGMSEDDWLTAYYANPGTTPANCGVTLATFEPTIVDGHPGRLATSGCYDTQVFVFVGNRVHIFGIWRGETDPSVSAYGGARRLFEAFLSTVTIQTASPSPS